MLFALALRGRAASFKAHAARRPEGPKEEDPDLYDEFGWEGGGALLGPADGSGSISEVPDAPGTFVITGFDPAADTCRIEVDDLDAAIEVSLAEDGTPTVAAMNPDGGTLTLRFAGLDRVPDVSVEVKMPGDGKSAQITMDLATVLKFGTVAKGPMLIDDPLNDPVFAGDPLEEALRAGGKGGDRGYGNPETHTPRRQGAAQRAAAASDPLPDILPGLSAEPPGIAPDIGLALDIPSEWVMLKPTKSQAAVAPAAPDTPKPLPPIQTRRSASLEERLHPLPVMLPVPGAAFGPMVGAVPPLIKGPGVFAEADTEPVLPRDFVGRPNERLEPGDHEETEQGEVRRSA
ncbi:MAG: hypothetical protein AAF871_15205 [Pseudomonadota bacterium]